MTTRLTRSSAAAGLLLGLVMSAAPCRADDSARVTFDRLTWAPDGSALAAEARFESVDGVTTDTLLIDLTRGSVASRRLHPALFAFDAGGTRLAAVDRYAVVTASIDTPDRIELLAGRDPARMDPIRLGFNAPGDSILLLSRTRGTSRYELVAWPWPSGRQVERLRTSSREVALRGFAAAAGPDRPVAVEAAPFPHLYQTIGTQLFHLEPSNVPVPGVPSLWLFNLFHRDRELGQSKLLANQVAPYESLVSPDSNWIAIAGHKARPDYGGRLERSLWIASADGSIFFSVSPSGEHGAHPADVRAMTWRNDHLWYSTPNGLYDLDPATGRAEPVRFGPPPPVWSANLEPSLPLWALLSRSGSTDTSQAIHERERLRQAGWPAWVAAWQPGSFRAAIGAEASEAALQPLAEALAARGVGGFSAARVDPAASGSPFPWAVVKSPVDSREAYLVSSGVPGFSAGEIWLTELHGARQIRLVKAMLTGPEFRPGSGLVPEPPAPAPR